MVFRNYFLGIGHAGDNPSEQSHFGRERSEAAGESPLHILKRRYAKGEITKEEFEKMKRDILRD